MLKKYRKHILLWLIVILYTLWIFHNSMQTGNTSAHLSQGISYQIYTKLTFLHGLPFQTFHTFIRKLAHFSEYALLGILVSLVSKQTLPTRYQHISILVWMILIPFMDEGIQYFTPGRSCELRDCFIDMSGYAFGWFLQSTIHHFIQRQKRG